MPSPEKRAEKAYHDRHDADVASDHDLWLLRRGYVRGWKECEREPRAIWTIGELAFILRAFDLAENAYGDQSDPEWKSAKDKVDRLLLKMEEGKS